MNFPLAHTVVQVAQELFGHKRPLMLIRLSSVIIGRNDRMKKYLAWVVVVLCIFAACIYHCYTREEYFDGLESSLRFLFCDDLGYTLVGEKPISTNDLQNLYIIYNKDELDRLVDFLNKTINKSDVFIIKIVRHCPEYTEIQLVHQKALADLIGKNKAFYAFIQRHYKICDNFLLALKNSKSVFECFLGNEELMGVALGYGESNSKYYVRAIKVGLFLKKYPLVCLLSFNPRPHPVSINFSQKHTYFHFEGPQKLICLPQFTSLEDEWKWIRRVKNSSWKMPEPVIPYLFQLPVYMSRKSKDSRKVERKFLKARDKLANLFCGKKFGEVIAEEAAKK